ncbi:MAG: DegQ family serine endoprotease [Proteobacteria bacterium]|nr:DegQ family serine endoprotease [Pseudomonadota bacterium]
MNQRKALKIFAVSAALALTAFSGWAAPAPESFAPLAERLTPSVVNISTTSTMKHPAFRGPQGTPRGQEQFREFFGDEFFRRFFGEDAPREFKSQSLGSGFILDRDGYVLTNNHVVEKADEIVVKLSDEHEFEAKVVGTDPKTDLALIRFEPKGVTLHPAELGDSDKIRVGDWVLAIGNPFGYGQTVTAGIVSAKGRVIGAGAYDNFLQTDAAINPGNSGGPLFDSDGKVVGINTAIVAGGTGIGFAIPVNLAREVVSQLKDKGKVTRGWLGVMIQEVTQELAKQFDLKEAKGALVAEVSKDGPADKAGIKRGDVILEFDGTAVDKMNQLPRLVAQRAPETTVKVVVLRKGDRKELSVTLGELKDEAVAGAGPASEQELGLTVQEITPELKQHLDMDVDQGLVVSGVEPDSPAAGAGLRRGDVILEVNQQEMTDLGSYRKALKEAKDKDSILFLVKRGQGTLYVVVPVKK